MAASGRLSREEAVSYYRHLLEGRLEGNDDEEEQILWGLVASYALSAFPVEFRGEVRRLVEEGKVSEDYVSRDMLDEIDRSIQKKDPRLLEPVGRWYRLIDDALDELEAYALLEAGIDEEDDDLGEE
jgi:hypothetical protein